MQQQPNVECNSVVSHITRNKPRAIILLSGGLDSATVLAIASQEFECHAISFDYAQRSLSEIKAAKQLAESYAASYQLIHIYTVVTARKTIHRPTIENIRLLVTHIIFVTECAVRIDW